MKFFFIISFIGLLSFCTHKQQKETAPFSNASPFKYEIKLCLLDTLDLVTSFWKINRQLEKQYPEKFKKPLNMADTTNKLYVTHLLKVYRMTYQGRTTTNLDRIPQLCVSKTDTIELRKFLDNPDYKNFFSPNSSFAYGVETQSNKGCLDLFALLDNSVSFKNADITKVFRDYNMAGSGRPCIVVTLSESAGRRFKDFLEKNLNRLVAVMINGSVYSYLFIGGVPNTNAFQINTELTEKEIDILLNTAK